MKNFMQLVNEARQFGKLAPSVAYATDPKRNTDDVGHIHVKTGVDYDISRPDSSDLSYFGKGIYRVKGKTTGVSSVAYIDWAKGTISFNSGDRTDDKKFDKPIKFKKGVLSESLEEIDQLNQLAENLEMLEKTSEPMKGRTYKAPSNDMCLKYTGRVEDGQYVYMVVDSQGKARIVAGKRHQVAYSKDGAKSLRLVSEAVEGDTESLEFNEATDWAISESQFTKLVL